MTRAALSSTLVATATAACIMFARQNSAQNNEMNVQFHGFEDTRGVTVLSPTVDLSQDFTERTSLRINYGLDAISAASDSCVRCHRDGINSHRQVVGLSAIRKYGDFKVTIGGAFSKENFYRATTGLTSVSRDLANGNTTIAGGFSFSLNQPTLHPLPDVENQYQSDGFGSVTQTLTKSTIVQAGYEIEHISGYQNNPYLRANVDGVLVLGQVPDLRTRQTLSARLRQALPADTYLEADYRHYFDDWQVTSNTIDVGVSHHFSPEFLMHVSWRRYDQTGAFFWAPEYSGVPQYFTADFRLEPFASNTYTGRIEIAPTRQWWFLPEGAALTMQYERYLADNGFHAGILSTGLRVPLKIPKLQQK
jgi:hypothetical protein